ncbi:MAG TPA: PhzF family phenazine biosynthesis protein [Terriglobales bacterium]
MPNSRQFPFVKLDVFTSRPLEGNQLAVFTDARGLSDSEMQSLAKEMNLSETTFILPGEAAVERERGVRVRIFTVEEELPFAGHPTLGTAFYLQQQRGGELIQLDLNVGKIPVRFETDENGMLIGEMTQRDPEFGVRHNGGDFALATGVPFEAIDWSLPIETVSTGMPFVMVPLKSLDAMRDLTFDQHRANEYLAKTDTKFVYWVTRETVTPGATLHARMLFYNGEDPATGSAAGCCTAWAVRNGVLASDTQGLIEQGMEMRRPSFIRIRATRAGESVTNIRVGGNVVEVMRGEALL